MGSNIIIGAMNYVFNILSGRVLGPEGYGDITTLFAYMAILTIPLAAISTLLIQKIGTKGDRTVAYSVGVEKWTFEQYRKYWFIFVFLLLLSPFMPFFTNLSPIAAYSIIPLLILSISATVYDGILTGLHYFFMMSCIGIFVVFIKLISAALGYILPHPLPIIILLYDISIITKIVLSKLFLNKKIKPVKNQEYLHIEKTVMQVVVSKQFLYTIGSVLSISLISSIDMIYAKKIFSSELAGLYAGWSLFAKVIIYAFSPLISMSYVFFSNKKQGAYHHLILMVSLITLLLCGIALNIGYGMYDRLLIEFLLGDKYLAVKPFIEWSAIFGIGFVMILFLNNYFLAKESRATLILPFMTALYVPSLIYYVKNFGLLIYFSTTFIIVILFLYLLMFCREKFLSLLT